MSYLFIGNTLFSILLEYNNMFQQLCVSVSKKKIKSDTYSELKGIRYLYK